MVRRGRERREGLPGEGERGEGLCVGLVTGEGVHGGAVRGEGACGGVRGGDGEGVGVVTGGSVAGWRGWRCVGGRRSVVGRGRREAVCSPEREEGGRR